MVPKPPSCRRERRVTDSTFTPRCLPAPPTTPIIAGGAYRSLAVLVDRTVWAWGQGDFGELVQGIGRRGRPSRGLRVPGPAEVLSVAAGDHHSLALDSSGAVWAWGANHFFQLGNAAAGAGAPERVAGLPGIVGIAAGADHSLAVDANGGVWAWGANFADRLGVGSTGHRRAPVRVPGLDAVVGIAAGRIHSLALRADGTVWAWGGNRQGQLGDASTVDRLSPVPVRAMSGICAITAGEFHSLALGLNGTVYSWGYNSHGQLGDGTTVDSWSPRPVTGLPAVSAVAAGYLHSLALANDGVAWAWGDNSHRQLGESTAGRRLAPVAVAVAGFGGAYVVAAVAAGSFHSLSVTCDGSLFECGQHPDNLHNTLPVERSVTVTIDGGGRTVGALDWDRVEQLVVATFAELAATIATAYPDVVDPASAGELDLRIGRSGFYRLGVLAYFAHQASGLYADVVVAFTCRGSEVDPRRFPDAAGRDLAEAEITRGNGLVLASLEPVLLPHDEDSPEYAQVLEDYLSEVIAFFQAHVELIFDALAMSEREWLAASRPPTEHDGAS
ncbi:MAG: RCC1 domain-containing protein [Acidimicrobiales bacterium]